MVNPFESAVNKIFKNIEDIDALQDMSEQIEKYIHLWDLLLELTVNKLSRKSILDYLKELNAVEAENEYDPDNEYDNWINRNREILFDIEMCSFDYE